MSVDRGTESSESHELGETAPQADVQEISETRAERDDTRAELAGWEQADLSCAPDADKHLPAQKPWTADEKSAIDEAVGLHAADESASAADVGTDAEPAGRHAGEPGELSAPTDDPGESTGSRENRDADSGGPTRSEKAGQPPKYMVVLDDARSNPSFDPASNTWSDRQHGDYVTVHPGETSAQGRERADRRLDVTHPTVTQDYNTNVPPTIDDRYLVRDQSNPVPVFDGPPTRNQTAQGQFGDCGIVATLGAVAAHRPEAIENTSRQTGDGEYKVTLHEVRPATHRDPVARPTGDTVTYKMNDELPVDVSDSTRPPAGMQVKTCAHNRLDFGSTYHERATLRAELTGSEAKVRTMPNEQQGEQALLDEFKDRLADGKPILVGTRGQNRGEANPYPYQNVFAFGHAYEMTKVDGNKIQLRNPWGTDDQGRSTDPPLMDVKTFWEYYRQYNHDGSRTGYYSTLR